MAKIKRDGFNGKVAGVQFANGQAETDNPGSVQYFLRREGYEVELGRRSRRSPEKQAEKAVEPEKAAEPEKDSGKQE